MRHTYLLNFHLSKIICKIPEVNSKPIHFLTFMNNDNAFSSLNVIACNYQHSDQFHLLSGHWQAKRYWISWDPGKSNLLENNPNNTRRDMKAQIQNKKNWGSISLGNYILIPILNTIIRYQILLILLELGTIFTKIVSEHGTPL